MQAVHTCVLRLSNAERTGARVVAHPPDTVIVYDCASWSDALSQRLRARFPRVEVDIASSSESLSGFVVVVRCSSGGRSSAWAGLLGLVLALSLYALYRLALPSGHTSGH
jgi:hypothetical protein